MGKKKQSRIKRTLSRIDPWILPLMEAIDCPRSLSVAILWRYKEYDQLVSLKANPIHYSTPRDYFRAAQATSLLRKFPDLPTSHKRRQAAFETFRGAEQKCSQTNEYLSRLMYEGPWDEVSMRTFAQLERARNLVSRILGNAPACFTGGAFGPGVSSQAKGKFVKSEKYVRLWDGTARLKSYLQGSNLTGKCKIGVIKHADKITTVPKTATTDRTIGIPIHANSYIQRGLGIALREKLDRYRKVRLQVTPEYHSWLASVAHSYGLSTIDLSSASDTVSYMLVRWLLPEGWFEWLCAARVDYYELEGKTLSYEKFSAMGNGYTFELETLIFYVLARATGASKHLCSTFGDDIIIEREYAQQLMDLLERVGFSVNVDKSFVTGSFFESCGSDYFDGQAVRPFFLKSVKGLNDLFLLANAISRIAQWPNGPDWWRDRRFRRAYTKVCALLGKYSKVHVPLGFESNGVVVPFDKALPGIKRSRDGWQGYKVKALMFRPDRFVNDSLSGVYSALDKEEEIPPLAATLGRLDDQSLSDWVIRPDRVYESYRKSGRWRVARLVVFGPWNGPLGWV